MSEHREIREGLPNGGRGRDKARRLVRVDPHQKVDASGYTPPDPLDADVKTGKRPKPRAYKSGGKVHEEHHMHGERAKHHAGRKPRATGGRMLPDALSGGNYVPSDHVKLNPTRAISLAGAPPSAGVNKLAAILGRKARKSGGHVHSDEAEDRSLVKKMVKKDALTGKCSGGRAKRATGGEVDEGKRYGVYRSSYISPKHAAGSPRKLMMEFHNKDRADKFAEDIKSSHHGKVSAHVVDRGYKRGGSVSDGEQEGTRPTGGREARATGGRAKGKTNINIIISQLRGDAHPALPMANPAAPAAPPVIPHPPMVPAGGGAPLSNPPGGGAQAPMGMPPGRKRGGGVFSATKSMERGEGAGGGLGRLKKIETYG